jgi:L-ribulose-5-phosphate 3-epimerase
MDNKFGVMQGRLLPKYQGRYQAHPKGYWQDEFLKAKEFGLDCIEFILDFNDVNKNPLLNKHGVSEILKLSNETGVAIKTVCADYLIEAPLHSIEESVAKKSLKILRKLIGSAVIMNITDIVIPCVDQSTLRESGAFERFIVQIKKIIPTIEKHNINLSLETDLAPKPFVKLLNSLDSKRITVNYDIGNSASLGFDSISELDAYGERISDIHIKDRLLNGGPVKLGDGSADFVKFFTKLKEFNYKGPFIMQAYRDNEGLEIFKAQLLWIKKVMKNSYEN